MWLPARLIFDSSAKQNLFPKSANWIRYSSQPPISYMNGRRMGSTVVCAAVAFAVGAYVGGQWSTRNGGKAGKPEPTSDHSDPASLRDENRRLREQLEQLRTTLSADQTQSTRAGRVDSEQSVRGEWRALANLKTQKIAQPRLTVVERPG